MAHSKDDTLSFAGHCREIIEKLDRAVHLHPREIETEVDQIQRDVVGLRDSLIEQLRKTQQQPTASQRHAAIDAINTALSLVASVEYPVTSIQRSMLEQARDTLKGISEVTG